MEEEVKIKQRFNISKEVLKKMKIIAIEQEFDITAKNEQEMLGKALEYVLSQNSIKDKNLLKEDKRMESVFLSTKDCIAVEIDENTKKAYLYDYIYDVNLEERILRVESKSELTKVNEDIFTQILEFFKFSEDELNSYGVVKIGNETDTEFADVIMPTFKLIDLELEDEDTKQDDVITEEKPTMCSYAYSFFLTNGVVRKDLVAFCEFLELADEIELQVLMDDKKAFDEKVKMFYKENI